MTKLLIVLQVLAVVLLAAPAFAEGPCEDSGACTLSGGGCGAECNGQCMSFDEARCCMSGQCYRNGSWCGGVECNGVCMGPEEARCCMSGCVYSGGSCQCAGN